MIFVHIGTGLNGAVKLSCKEFIVLISISHLQVLKQLFQFFLHDRLRLTVISPDDAL